MRRSLLNSCFYFFFAGIVLLSCSNKTTGSKAISASKADTSAKNSSAPGPAVKSNQAGRGNPGRDTVLRNKTAIMNNSQNQAVTDSIKNEKTKKKK